MFAPRCGRRSSFAVDENDFTGFGDGVAVGFEATVIHQVGEYGLGGVGGVGFAIG